MRYLSAYWIQVMAFYRLMWQKVFAKERNIEGELSAFVMRPGYFWDLVSMHGWFILAVLKIPALAISIVFGYLVFSVMLFLFFIAPAVILIVFPMFLVRNYRQIQRKGAAL